MNPTSSKPTFSHSAIVKNTIQNERDSALSEGYQILNDGYEVIYALNHQSDRIDITGNRNDEDRKIFIAPLCLGESPIELMSLNDYLNSRIDVLEGANLTNVNLAQLELSNDELRHIYFSRSTLHADDLEHAYGKGVELSTADLVIAYHAGAKLHENDLTRIYRTGANLRDDDWYHIVPRLYQNHGLSETISIQAQIRRFLITGLPEKKGWVPALRQPSVNEAGQSDGKIGKPIAYAVSLDDENHFAFKALPGESDIPIEKRPKGSSKRLDYTRPTQSARDANRTVEPEFVGMTLLYTENPSKLDHITYRPDIFNLIKAHQLTQFVPQIRINESQMMSVNLGPNLAWLIQNGAYKHNLNAFVLLAKQVSILHKAGYVHRDFNPTNMHFDKNGNVCVPDNDSIQPITTCCGANGTPGYVHVSLQDVDFEDHITFACKVDHYEILVSIMHLEFPSAGMYPSGEVNRHDCRAQFEQFIHNLPCNDDLKMEVKCFLTNPARNSLSLSLENYLQPPGKLD